MLNQRIRGTTEWSRGPELLRMETMELLVYCLLLQEVITSFDSLIVSHGGAVSKH
jgi:hypothetical protein